MTVNDWGLYCSGVFEKILDDLTRDVLNIKENDPLGYIHNAKAKLLKRVYQVIVQDVPQNPLDAKFNLGKNVLGKHRQSWKRAKAGLPDRYRLFFKRSTDTKTIVYAWVNNENCLRNAGGKTDVYRVFETMLRKREIAEEYDDLLSAANELEPKKTQISIS
jgi:toxin YhaV